MLYMLYVCALYIMLSDGFIDITLDLGDSNNALVLFFHTNLGFSLIKKGVYNQLIKI